MNKKYRQYIGLAVAVLTYYVIQDQTPARPTPLGVVREEQGVGCR